MTREQLSQLVTVEDMLQLKSGFLKEMDDFKMMLKQIRLDMEEAGAVKPAKLHLSPKEFADKLGVGYRTVHNWCNDGTILASQPNGFNCTWLIPVSELERMSVEKYTRYKPR